MFQLVIGTSTWLGSTMTIRVEIGDPLSELYREVHIDLK